MWMLIVVGTICVEFLLNNLARILNLRAMMETVPGEFKEFYDQERYTRSQEYTKDRMKFGAISATFSVVVTLTFILAGGFPWLDLLVRGWSSAPVIQGLLFFAVLGLGSDLLSLPFSLYSTFSIEERYGFNKMTMGTFVGDHLKGYLIAVLIGGPVLGGLLWFFGTYRDFGWLYAWGLMALFTVIAPVIFTSFIAPIFNKFEPLEEGNLMDAIRGLARKTQFSVQRIYVMDGSKRSGHSNAYFSGFGKFKRIALFDTLIEQHPENELVAILAHEIGHYKLKHILWGTVISIGHLFFLFWILSWFLGEASLFTAFDVAESSVYMGLALFSLVFSPISLVLGIVMNYWSRQNEYAADRYSAETIGESDSMITGLKRLSAENLSNLTPHGLSVMLHASHPTALERVAALRSLNLSLTKVS